MKSFLKFVLSLLAFIPSANLLADERYTKISSESGDKDFHVYYYFSFHCHACAKWSPTFEKQLKSLDKQGVRVHFAPLSVDRAERLLSRGYVLTKGYGVNDISQDYFNLYKQAYYITDSKVKDLVSHHLKNEDLKADPWSKQSLLYVDMKINKYMQVARDSQVNSTPCFVVSGPTGIYKVMPSEDLHPNQISGVLESLTQLS